MQCSNCHTVQLARKHAEDALRFCLKGHTNATVASSIFLALNSTSNSNISMYNSITDLLNSIFLCTVLVVNSFSLHYKIEVALTEINKTIHTKAMIDFEATMLFIHTNFCKKQNILTQSLKWKITLYNIDSSKNFAESIIQFAKLQLTVSFNKFMKTF